MFNGDLHHNISMLHNPKGIHTSGGNFKATQTDSLIKALNYLLLPKDGYHFYPDVVENLVLMTVVSNHNHIVMDTNVDNAIYVFNDNRMYIQFQQTKRNIYTIHIGETVETEHCYFTTVKGMEIQYSDPSKNV